jgi:hypothetical protein
MVKHFCDRCGNEIHQKEERIYVRPKDQDADIPIGMKVEYELCLNCKRDLRDFLGGIALATR